MGVARANAGAVTRQWVTLSLKAYAVRWRGDQGRWRLVSMNPESLRLLLAVAGAPGAGEKHTRRFVLADSSGLVRGSYDGADEAEMHRLIPAAALLH
jgi:hypothetical protein